ncbi:hypothetical protein EDB84DRAFT_1477914 [Lactarius hengduanensis]|nr:hypothetical protein EDB84DRAFT_1477914 [Lactarius hengduanensis]
MYSHKTLALLALAASTASPALSAPVLEGQQQTRASAAAAGGITDILKTIGTGLAFGALPVVLQDVLGGNSTRRDTPHIIVDGLPVPIVPLVPSDTIPTPAATPLATVANRIPAPPATPVPDDLLQRGIGSAFGDLLDSVSTSGSIGKVLGDGLLGGVASAAGAVGAGRTSQLHQTILGAGTSLGTFSTRMSTSRRELKEALQLLSRQLDELD